jgi:uncharacterized protein DUF4397
VKLAQFLGFLTVLLTLAGAAGCKSAGTIAGNAHFRVMNAAVEQPNLTFLLTATTVASGLAYPTASAYNSQVPGGYTVHVEPAGTTATLINQPIVLQANTSYTFIAAEAAFASPALTPIFLTDDNTAPATGQLKVRAVNASPDAGNLDVYVVSPGASIQNVNPTFTNLGFKSASGYQSLVPGNYEIYFTPAGQKTVVTDSGALTLHAGQVRTVVALDSAGGFASTTLADVN